MCNAYQVTTLSIVISKTRHKLKMFPDTSNQALKAIHVSYDTTDLTTLNETSNFTSKTVLMFWAQLKKWVTFNEMAGVA